ncbi:hypothetical protein [Janthinobacterium sp.]|uniref:hypothetical protein n=1 Tax=Janthinobacterium sp. TaxID=1871054 RepID=UPI002611C39B|nr:hypothetical protein [Janthinobacterium sp.]
MKKTIPVLTLLASVLLAGASQAAAPSAFTVDVTGQGQPIILIPGPDPGRLCRRDSHRR